MTTLIGYNFYNFALFKGKFKFWNRMCFFECRLQAIELKCLLHKHKIFESLYEYFEGKKSRDIYAVCTTIPNTAYM